jgi:hypothetical protein
MRIARYSKINLNTTGHPMLVILGDIWLYVGKKKLR